MRCLRRAAPVLSIYRGTLPKLLSKPSFDIILEQNTASFATSSASIVDCAAGPCSPTLKMIMALASTMMYDDVDLPL